VPKGIGLLGQKVGMTQVFDREGRAVGATVIVAGPCVVTGIMTVTANGYDAVQAAFREEPKVSRLGKPRAGIFAKLSLPAHRKIGEFRPNPARKESLPEGIVPGAKLTVILFKPGDRVDVQGRSKGKGFQGVVKRHGFKGGPDTHGSMQHRAPGSVGSSTDPGHTLRGTRMGGRTGNATATSQNLEVLDIDEGRSLLVVKGAVPGAVGAWLSVTPSVKKWAPSARRLHVEMRDTEGAKTAGKKPAAAAKK
jgi:large subunit ribosomal protein L3